MPDVYLKARDGGRGAHDVELFAGGRLPFVAYLYERDAGRGAHDVELRSPAIFRPVVAAGGFPAQFAGLRYQGPAGMVELSLVAVADAPAGMGGVLKIRKGVTDFAVYLVETSDGNASAIRMRTSTGTKAIRKKT